MKLFVFDLDFTLWDAGGTWCDCTYPPYKKFGDHLLDVDGRLIKMYPDVKEILVHLKNSKKNITIASRTGAPEIATQLIELFKIYDFFSHPQIYPGSKVTHFQKIRQKFGIDFTDMIFFDDEYRNIREVSALGVHCEFLGDGGINWDMINPYL